LDKGGKKMKKFLMVTVLAVILSTTNLFAETYVSGTIVNETWNSSGSPYYVEGNILVAGLTIEPGVRVEFLDDYVFEVAGVLTAIGTEEDLILFTTADTNENGWQGIFFNYSSPGSIIAYCTIEESINSGIRIEGTTDTPVFRNCTISNNSRYYTGGGIWITGSGRVLLEGCKIDGNTAFHFGGGHPYGGGIYVVGELELNNCQVINNLSQSRGSTGGTKYSRGGGIFSNGELKLSNTLVENNIADAFGSNSSMRAHGGGIYIIGTGIIKNCIIHEFRLS